MVVWVVVVLAALEIARVGVGAVFPAAPSSVSESCDPILTPSECQLRQAECGVVNSALQPAGGPVSSLIKCSAVVGVGINPAVFSALGTHYLTGVPTSLADLVGSDSASTVALRYCVLNSTGLVLPDGKLDRAALVEKLASEIYFAPSVVSALTQAVNACSEPVDFKVDSYIACVRSACLRAVVPLPYGPDDLDPPGPDLLLAALPTSVPLNAGYWAV